MKRLETTGMCLRQYLSVTYTAVPRGVEGPKSLNVHDLTCEIERLEEHPDEMDARVKNRYFGNHFLTTDA